MRKSLFSAAALAGALCIPVTASAATIAATNLDTWIASGSAGVVIAGPTVDSFQTVDGTPVTGIGLLTNIVYFNSETGEYTYTHMVTSAVNNVSEFNTAFGVNGFTGTAGFSFAQSLAAGGTGTAADVEIEQDPDGTIDNGIDLNGAASGTGFDTGESITFFFVSVKPPTLGQYNLLNSEGGQATSFAPVPEPGSMALLGSGLLSLYGAARRRRKARA